MRAGGLQTALLPARLVPVVPLVHAPGHSIVPAAMEGHSEIVRYRESFLLGGEDPPRPVPSDVDEEEIERVEPATLEEGLNVRLVGDELLEFAGSRHCHAWSLGAGFPNRKPAGKGVTICSVCDEVH